MAIEKAVRSMRKIRLMLYGPSGGGKTLTALLLGLGVVREIGNGARLVVIDTQGRQSAEFAEDYDFDILPIESPFEVQKFADAMRECSDHAVVVVDSLSPFWGNYGGVQSAVLESAVGSARRKSARYNKEVEPDTRSAWSTVGNPQSYLIESAIAEHPGHVITTCRYKDGEKSETYGHPEIRGSMDYGDGKAFVSQGGELRWIQTRAKELEVGSVIDKPGMDYGALLYGSACKGVRLCSIADLDRAVDASGVSKPEAGKLCQEMFGGRLPAALKSSELAGLIEALPEMPSGESMGPGH